MTKKKNKSLKIILLITAAALIILAGVPLLFSEQYLIQTLQASFQQKTGLNLNIDKLSFSLLNHSLKLTDISTISPGNNQEIAHIDEAEISLSHKDLYDIFFNEKIYFHDLSIKKLSFRNISKDCLQNSDICKIQEISENPKILHIIENSSLIISELTLSAISPDVYSYNMVSTIFGDCNGGGKIKGEIHNLHTRQLSKIVLTGTSESFVLNLDSLDIRNTYSGTVKLRNNFCDFSGKHTLNLSPLKILSAPDDTTYTGSGTWNLIEDQVNFSELSITNAQGMKLLVNGRINNPLSNSKRVIDVKVLESTIPVPILNLQENRLSINLGSGFNFKGNILLKSEVIDIFGTAQADSVIIDNPEIKEQTKGRISAEMQVTSNSLNFTNFTGDINSFDVQGNIYIPFSAFRSQSLIEIMSKIESDISVAGELENLKKTISPYQEFINNDIIIYGNFDSKISFRPGNETSNFNISVNTDNNFAFSLDNSITRNAVNSMSAGIAGHISKSQGCMLDRIKVVSKPLLIDSEVTQKSGGNNNILLKIDADLTTLKPMTGSLIPDFFDIFSRFKINTTANYNSSSHQIQTTENQLELFFKNYANPSSIMFNGNFDLSTQKEMQFSFPQITMDTISLATSNKTYKSSSAILKGNGKLLKTIAGNNFSFGPSGEISAGIRSQNNAIFSLITKFFNRNIDYFSSKNSAIKSRISFDSDDIRVAATMNSSGITLGNPVIFTEDNLQTDLSFSYNISTRKLTINNFSATDRSHDYNIIASGSIYTENVIFDNFHSKINADLSGIDKKLRGYFKSYQQYDGKLELIAELAGTAGTPTLSIVGKSDKVSVSEDNFTLVSLSPKIDAEFEWSRDLNGQITDLIIKNIFLTSNDGAVFISGKSDKIRFDKYGYANFGSGCNFDMAFKGNKKLLWIISPEFSSYIKDIGTNDSFQISGNIQAQRLPLLRFDKESEFEFFRSATINNGKFQIDRISAHGVTAENIHGNLSLNDNILAISDGTTDIAGKVDFSTSVDFTQTPTGSINIRVNNADLANILSYIPLKTPVLNGWLQAPRTENKNSFSEFTWKGSNFREIIDSLKSKRDNIKITDLVVETVIQRQNWEKILSQDVPPSIAAEIAKSLDQKFSQNYGKKKKVYYKHFDIDYTVSDKQIKISRLSCGGGNTADFIATGVISFDGRIILRVYPVKNLKLTFDTSTLTQLPAVQGILADLPPETRSEISRILPDHLEKLASQRKLFIDITGTADNPDLNFDYLRKELRNNIPVLIDKFKKQLKGRNIIDLLMGGTSRTLNEDPQAVDKIKDITNMNLSDIIKMID